MNLQGGYQAWAQAKQPVVHKEIELSIEGVM
jgi:hypothetical protein